MIQKVLRLLIFDYPDFYTKVLINTEKEVYQ